jgi:ABC-type polysaccharide/polyol phosphate export permease
MVHFLLALPILALFVVMAGVPIPVTWLALPVVVMVHALLLNGIVLALSALNVFYRDVQHLVGNLLTLLFFLCPVVYPVTLVPEKWRFLITYNPLAALTQFYQQILIEGVWPPVSGLVYVLVVSLVVGICGIVVHNHYKERFAEAL